MKSIRPLATAAWVAAALSVPAVVHAQTVKPAITRDVGTATPVNAGCIVPAGASMRCTMYTVPVGKRLVVQQVTHAYTFPGATQPVYMLYGVFDPGGGYVFGSGVQSVSPVLVYSDANFRFYGGSQPFSFTVEENQAFSVSMATSTGTFGPQGLGFGFHGYLVDK